MKCKGCNKEAVTKKGWCSIDCYRKNQVTGSTNSGRFIKGNKLTENTKKKIGIKSKLAWQNNYDFMVSTRSHSSIGKGHIKENHPNWKEKIIKNCPICHKQFKVTITSKRVYCSKKCGYLGVHNKNKGKIRVEKIRIQCELCGKEKFIYPSLIGKAKYCSIKCHNISNVLKMPTKRTTIEIKLAEILNELNITFKEQVPIETLTVVDFFVEPNIIIYADGIYWHNRPEVKKRDAYINKILKEKQYKVIRISELDLKNNVSFVKESLIRELL